MKTLIKKGMLGLCLFLMAGMAISASDIKEEHVVWKKLPIDFVIPAGQERILNFNEPVILQDSELTGKDVSLSIHNGAVYIKSHQAFEPKRAQFKLVRSGQVVIVDISSREEEKDSSLLTVLTDSEESNTPSVKEREYSHINYISLTRFAIQSLYSPERLLEMPAGVSRAPMYTHKTVTLVYGDAVMARPIVSWQGGGLFVTAVLLKNKLQKSVTLEPESLIGQWQTAVFYPANTLAPKGEEGDTVTVIVTSSLPFGKALDALQEV